MHEILSSGTVARLFAAGRLTMPPGRKMRPMILSHSLHGNVGGLSLALKSETEEIYVSIATGTTPGPTIEIQIHHKRNSPRLSALFTFNVPVASTGGALALSACETGISQPLLDWLAGEWRDGHTNGRDVVASITRMALANEAAPAE